MKIKYLLIFSVLIITKAHSLDCGQLHSGESLRIDTTGKSMENFRHQDQDGLGICYATAVSAQLQSVLPTHPEISYFQLAALVGNKEVEKKLQDNPQDHNLFVKKKVTNASAAVEEDDKWTFAMTGGTTCDTIAAAQEEQRKKNKSILCPKNKTNIEELIAHKGDADFMQLNVFLESAKYMNEFHSALSGQDQKNNFSKSFEDLISHKRHELESSTCHKTSADGLEAFFHNTLGPALAYQDCFNPSYTRRNEYWCKMVRTIAPDAKQKTSHSLIAKQIGSPLLMRIKTSIEQNKQTFSVTQIKNDFKKALINEAKVEKYEMPEAKDLSEELAGYISDENLQLLVDEYNEIKTTGFSKKCVDRLLMDYVSSKKFENDYMKSEVLCENQALMKQAAAVAFEYSRSGLKDLNSVYNFLKESAGLPYHEAMMSLNANDCTEADKINIPDNIKCEYHAVKPETKNSTDEIIFNQLSQNKAITIGFCAHILEKPKSSFGAGECGNHSVNIIGLKCVDGKYNYLIQNSWGIDYEATNTAIKTEVGTDKHWLDESTFNDSVYGLTTLDLTP